LRAGFSFAETARATGFSGLARRTYILDVVLRWRATTPY
jgi:hypothetical protein